MSDVTIYTRQFCGYCAAAKTLLDKKNVNYVEHDATFSKAMRQEMIGKAGGQATFPQIFVAGQHIGGCDELMALEKSGRLDPMLGTA